MSQIPSPPRPRVVLAEDDTLLLEAFTRLLAPNFEVVGTASDGDEAVSVALRVKPDLVLLDARMPRSSGFEAARRLRTELPGVPIVFLTGIRDPQLGHPDCLLVSVQRKPDVCHVAWWPSNLCPPAGPGEK